ncbi:Toll-like receptor 2 [Varanus komodoensis]|uniref:Monocyte differentiation antigen CD14 n=1 Tax=Varanus komodoensis TaxID=61221 RepID=A0A8D2KUW5_VARKO|nr:monocyte differentiation antigen CD14 [Varanus komodoensis]XP_044278759.1 monocyte differentiation antigen CD14 [Varanus komodoensis]KAF7235468.1 Toll-like receptor 2 [Varanus komodoensis]
MWRTQPIVFFLLLGLSIPKAKGNCKYIESQLHCVCSLAGRADFQNYLSCLAAETYELRGGNLEHFQTFSGLKPSPPMIDILRALQVKRLVFTDVLIPEILLPGALEFVSYAPLVSELKFTNCTFLNPVPWSYTGGLDLRVPSLCLHRVVAAPLGGRLGTFGLGRWLRSLENLTVTESQVTSVPCATGKMFSSLHFLDLSGNRFQEQGIASSFCEGAFPQLQILKLQRNSLTSYGAACQALSRLQALTHLDLSQNHFLPEDSSSHCSWPASLRIFNLSNTGLEHMDRSLPRNVEILDLSANKMLTLDLSIPSLKELYLSNNSLQAVPSVDELPGLKVLSLDQNQLSHLPLKALLRLEHLQSLKAGHNLFNCSCRNYITDIQGLAAKPSLLQGWPREYLCSSPPNYQTQQVAEVPLPSLQCNKARISHGSLITLLLCLHLACALLPTPLSSHISSS